MTFTKFGSHFTAIQIIYLSNLSWLHLQGSTAESQRTLHSSSLSLSTHTHTVTHTRTLNTTAQHTRTHARARAPQREADGTHNRAQSMRAVPWMAPPTDHHEHELIVPLEGRPSPSCLPSVAKATSRSIISCTPGAVGSLWTAQGSGLGSYSPHIPHPHTPHLDRAR